MQQRRSGTPGSLQVLRSRRQQALEELAVALEDHPQVLDRRRLAGVPAPDVHAVLISSDCARPLAQHDQRRLPPCHARELKLAQQKVFMLLDSKPQSGQPIRPHAPPAGKPLFCPAGPTTPPFFSLSILRTELITSSIPEG